MKNFFSKTLNRCLAVLIALVLAVNGIPIVAQAEKENPSDDYTYDTSDVNASGTEDDADPQDDDPQDDDPQDDDPSDDDPSDEGGESGQEADFVDGEEEKSGVAEAPADAEAHEAAGIYSIVAFAPLADSVANQAVEVGALIKDVTLPDTLDATVSDGDIETDMDIEGVTWQSEPEFEAISIGETEIVPAGTYVFMPVLPEGYDLSDGVALPVITVEVVPVGIMPVATIWNGGTQGALNINDDTITVIGTVTLTGTLNCTGNVTFTGGGTLMRGSGFQGTFISVPEGASVTLMNVTLDGNSIETTAPAIKLSGKLTMESGATIQNFIRSTGDGAALSLDMSTSMVTMNGGKITDNKSRNYGGAIYINSGAFIMNAGEITNNAVTLETATYGGGGIYNRGTCIINGGEISGNVGKLNGGGIYNSSFGTLKITGGIIQNNSAQKGNDIFHSSRTSGVDALLEIGGSAYIGGDIYLDVTTGFKYVVFTSAIMNTVALVVPSPAENLTIGQGTDSYALTKVDMQKINIQTTGTWYPKLTADNKFVLTETNPGYGNYYYISYDSNGGSGIVADNNGYSAGDTVTLKSAAALSHPTKTFIGWQYGGTTYQAGATFTMPASNAVFTAIWEDAHTYSISLAPAGAKDFGSAAYGYGAQAVHSVTVTNTGIQPTNALNVALSGANSGSFTLSHASITSIAVGGSGSFTVTPKTGLAVGTHTATVTVSGGNGISASFGVSFEVTKASQAAFTITNPGTKTYGDANFNLTLSANGSGTGTVTYQSNNTSVATVSGSTVTIIGAGTAGITATKAADGTYNSAADTVTFTVNKATLTPSINFGGVSDRAYNGTANITGAAISLSGAVHGDTPAASASFAFANKDVGANKTVNATGITLTGAWGNNYALSAASLTGIASGKAITAAPLTITGFGISKVYDGTTAVTGGFGTLSFSGLQNSETATVNAAGVTAIYNNANVGAGKAVTLTGSFGMTGGTANGSNYTITQPTGVTGAITAKALSWSNGTVNNKTYDGTNAATINAAPTLTGVISGDMGTITVTAGTAIFASANAGSQSVTASGWSVGGTPAGNYTLPVSQPSFAAATINQKPLENSMIAAISNRTYTGSAIEPAVTVTDGAPSIITTTDYTVSYSDNQNAGTATVTVTGKGNYSGTATKSFTIDKASNNLVITCADISFGGTVSPQVAANTSGGAVSYEYKTADADDSTYSSTVPTAVGDYTVRATSAATANYNSATATADFGIGKEDPTVNWPDGLTAEYGQTLADVTLPTDNGAGTAGSFSWTTSTTPVGNAGTQQHSLTFTPSNGTSYNTAINNVDVEVGERNISHADVGVISDQIYTGSAIQPVLSVSDSGAAITSSDYDASFNNNISVGTANVTLTGKRNYTGTKTNAAAFNIVAAALGNQPDISGTVRIGETLTADTTPLNAHGDSGTAFSYQWNAGGVTVDGATSSTYEIQGSDAGKTITVTVTATGNYEGSATSDSVTVPYKIIVTAYNSDGDSVTANEVYQNAGDTVAIEYTLAATHIENKLVLSTGSTSITTITTPDTASYNYTVNAAHADTSGVITITAAFSHTSVLMSANVSITAPQKAAEPQDATTTESSYTITDTVWSGDLTSTDKFAGEEIYSVTVTLEASGNATFDSSFTPAVIPADGTIGNISITDDGTKATFTVTYPALPARAVSSISVTTQPKLTYVTGDKLDLSDLCVEVTYDDTSTENIKYDAAGLTCKIVSDFVESGTALISYSKHDGEIIVVSYDNKTADTESLTVYKTTKPQIAVSDIDSTSAVLTYSVTTDSRNTVTSKLQVKSGSVWTDVEGASSPYTASGLSSNTGYEYRIWVQNNTTSNAYDKAITFRTAESAPAGITISGTVTDSSNPSSIIVTIEHGNTVIASNTIDGSGTYDFIFHNIPNGIYNLVSDNGSYKVTQAVTVTGVDVTDIQINMDSGKTQSIIEIIGDTPPAAVGGLPKLFEDDAIYTTEDRTLVDDENGTVEIKLEIEAVDNPSDARDIGNAASGQEVGFYLDLSVIKSRFDSDGMLMDTEKLENLSENDKNLITITFELPDRLKGKSNLTIYRVHKGIVEKLPPNPNPFDESVDISDGIVTLNVCKFSIYAIAYTTTKPNPPSPNPPSPPSSTSDDDDSSSDGGSGGGTTPAIISTYWIEAPEAKEMAKSAKEQGADIARSRRATITGIRKASSLLLSESGLRYQHDTVANSAVQVRVYVDNPSLATKDILVSGYVTGDAVDKAKAIFGKWYQNKIAVVSFDAQGDFGMKIEAAAKVDLSGMDTSSLYFYSYDKAANKYIRVLTEYRIDSSGYLRFATTLAGSIIISDGPLSGNAEPQNPGTGGDSIAWDIADLENPNTGGDGIGMLVPPTQAQAQSTIAVDALPAAATVDSDILKLESRKLSAAGVGTGSTISNAVVFNLDAPMKIASDNKPSVWLITGFGVLMLLAAAVLWAVIPRKNDVLVQDNKRRL